MFGSIVKFFVIATVGAATATLCMHWADDAIINEVRLELEAVAAEARLRQEDPKEAVAAYVKVHKAVWQARLTLTINLTELDGVIALALA